MATISTNHARPAAFRRMLRNDASPGEVQTIVRHLLAGCEACQARLTDARRAEGNPATWSYDRAFARLSEEPEEVRDEPVAARSRVAHVHP